MRLKELLLLGLALPLVAGSCALPFPEYDLEQQDSSTGTGSGGAGGAGPLGVIGDPCDSPGDCADGNCLQSNTGEGRVCCASECLPMGEASCGRNGNCDASGGDCALYSAGIDCGEATCAGGVLTAQQCQAAACALGESTSCVGGFECEDEDTCLLECETTAECTNPGGAPTGAECLKAACAERPAGAQCDDDSQCKTGHCGTTGTGHCCKGLCSAADDACGATDCDSEGDCVFPAQDTPCGTAPVCKSGGNLETVYCNGNGGCTFESTRPCPGHLRCFDPASCYAACGSNDATGDQLCPPGYWCDGATCHQASWDEGSACLRDGQCSSNDCTPAGQCIAAGCDVDNDGFIRDDPHCVGGELELERDCDDNDARAFPGQTDFFDTPRANGGYDFDCDRTEERKYETECTCSGTALLVPAGAEGCGVTGNLGTCFQIIFFLPCQLAVSADTATQTCR